MEILGPMMMLGSIFGGAASAEATEKKMQTEIKAAKAQSAKMQEQFATILNTDELEEAALQKEVVTSLQSFARNQQSLNASKKAGQSTYKKLQLEGLIFIAIVFFLLLMKRLGFFWSVMGPIIAPWQLIFGLFDSGTKKTQSE